MTMRRAPIVIFCAAMIVTLSMGVRQSFGLFLPDMSVGLGIGRSDFGLALAVQNLLFGLLQPFTGALGDRYGAGRLVVVGAIVYALGLIGASFASTALGLYLSFGLLVGMAMSACTFVTVLGAVGRVVPPEKRSLAFGLVTAGGSLGQFLVVPAGQLMIAELGWRMALVALAGLISVMIVLSFGVAGRPQPQVEQGADQSLAQALREAGGERSFWLLNAGFLVCGFHIAFIGTHFPAYLTDQGLSLSTGANALALVGLFNILGSWFFGVMGDRWQKKGLLAALYAARSGVMVIFLVLPLTPVTALAFAAAMGFLWLGTVPLTSGLIGTMFGIRYLSTLYGIVFLSHQVGSFLGAWSAGLIFDLTGSYDSIWIASVALGLFAALIHLPIRERPVARLQPA